MARHLHVARADAITLPAVLSAFAAVVQEEDGHALLYSPAACTLAVLDAAGSPQVAPGSPAVAVDPVFEARAFNRRAELRWRRTGSSPMGRAVLLTLQAGLAESLASGGHGFIVDGNPPVIEEKDLCRAYVLWGRGTGALIGKGWSQLATPRIGALAMPLAGVEKDGYVRLHAVEHLARDQDGNVYVLAERLTGFLVYSGHRPGADGIGYGEECHE